MRKKKQGKTVRLLKFLFIFIFAAALLVFSLHVFVDTFENELFDIIAGRFEKSSGDRYAITCDYADLNLFKRSIHIKNLSINTNTAATADAVPKPGNRETILRSDFADLRLEGISILPLILRKSLCVDNVILEDGKLAVSRVGGEAGKEQPLLSIPDMFMRFSGLEILPKNGLNPKIHMRIQSGEAGVKNPVFHSPDGFYTVQAKSLDFSKSLSAVSIRSFELIPRYKPYEFSRKKGYRTSRLSLKVDQLLFRDIDFNDLFKEQAFHSASLSIQEPIFEIFRNRNMQPHPRPRTKKFPQQLLREMKLKLRIDNIDISKGSMFYTEHPKDGKRTGALFFTNIQADVKNLSNYPQMLKEKTSLLISASAKIMGSGLFRARFTFPLEEKKGASPFTFSGSLDSMNVRAFNPFLENCAFIRINRGTLKKLYFSVWADENKAEGEMRIFYKHLKISMLKRGSTSGKRRVVSFLANTIIHKNNPREGKPLRIGRIYFERETKKSFFNYLWKSLLSGIKSSIGLKKRKAVQ